MQSAIHEAVEHYHAGNREEATQFCRALLVRNPRQAQAHYLLALIARDEGRLDDALTLFAHAFGHGLDDPDARFQYARVLAQAEQRCQAIAQLERALRKQPGFTEARWLLIDLLLEGARYQQAGCYLRRLINENPEEPIAHYRFGLCQYYLRDLAAAERHFRRALDLAPEWRGEIHARLSALLEEANRPGAAEAHARQALELLPDDLEARTTLAKVLRRRGELDDALACIDRLDGGKATNQEHARALAERGEILEQLGRYDEAFQAFHWAKRGVANIRRVQFEIPSMMEALRRAERFFTPERMMALCVLGHAGDSEPVNPVFVTGFPRSGTTLLERMLSQHEGIATGGELDLIPRLEAELANELGAPYPACLEQLIERQDAETLSNLRRRYQQRLREEVHIPDGTRWVIDKLPFNLAHLPLIRILFPAGVVVDMVRHPLDTLLSCYFQTSRNDYPWSFRLSDTALVLSHLREHVDRMEAAIAHPATLRMGYEALVAAPETELGRVLNALGLPWEPALLRFHERGEMVRDAGYKHIAESLHDQRVYRHRRYQNQIPPELLQQLGGTIRGLGYEVADYSSG